MGFTTAPGRASTTDFLGFQAGEAQPASQAASRPAPSIHLYTDPETGSTFFPIRLGYASTIYKMQGATLPHVTIWMNRPSRAAAYVAMSRVRRDEDYLFGGILEIDHFMPAF